MMIDSIIKKRAASDEKNEDALQQMLDQGDRAVRIVEFIVGALFAGLINSGINAGWVSGSRCSYCKSQRKLNSAR
jgi:sterol 14-demethylase